MPSPVRFGLMFPIGPNVPVDNFLNCNEGTIRIGGFLYNVPVGEKCNVIAKVYSGTPYTNETMPAAPPQNLVESGEDFVGREGLMGTFCEMKVDGVLCAYFGTYPDVQILIWASLDAPTPESFVYTKSIVSLKGVAMRPTEPMRYPMMPGM